MTVIHGGKSLRDRNLEVEAHLMRAAVRATRHADDGGLSAFADSRAWPGGVRTDLDPDGETREELADARNYLVWGLERDFAAYLRGDAVATVRYARRLRALSAVIEAWQALRD